jgi:hypothetical protein
MKRLIFALAVGLLTVSALAVPPTQITSPTIITVPGSYILANDITLQPGQTAIDIQVSDVTINLNEHTINAPSGSAGIIINRPFNVVVTNVHISNGTINAGGIALAVLGSYCLINNLKITAGVDGIAIEGGDYNRIHNCVITCTGQQETLEVAVGLILASHNIIQNNTISGTATAFSEIDHNVSPFGSETVVGDNTISDNQFVNPTP